MKSFTWKYNKTVNFGEITEVLEENNGVLIARYETEKMFGLMNPLIKIDMNRKLIYFLTEESFNSETNFPQFETRGIKAEIYN